MKKKIPVPGATGLYIVPELLSMGYAVDGVTPDHAVSDHPDLRYILTDASKDENLFSLLQNEHAGIVDFLIYSIPTLKKRFFRAATSFRKARSLPLFVLLPRLRRQGRRDDRRVAPPSPIPTAVFSR